MRRKIDRGWLFQRGDVAGAQEGKFDDSTWLPVDLPHDWSVEGPFRRENFIEARLDANHLEGRADSYLPKGVGWYRKQLDVGAPVAGGRVHLEFEGVFRDSALWVNGHLAGKHRSGYTGVVYDITPWLNGDGTPDVLAVRVDARDMEGWWYEGAGIYRHVWLSVKPSLHVAPWGLAVTTTHVSCSSAVVNMRTQVANSSALPLDALVRGSVEDGLGNLVGAVETRTVVGPGQAVELIQEIPLANPKLWAPSQPHLYTARSRVVSPEGEEDCQETAFGVRWFEFTADKGFFLNGQPFQLRGGNVHHDFGGLGTALPDRANFKTVEVLKEMGCNIIRSSHNPAAPSLMDACDRLGMLFWAETRNLYLEAGAADDLRDLIRRDRNHPCVVVWGLANTAGSPDDRLTACLRQLNELAHQLDSSRPTVVGLEGNADANANGFADVTDVVGYNGGGMGVDDRDHRMFPWRKMLVSEFSSGRGARGVYKETAPASSDMETFGDGRTMKRAGHYCSEFDLCLSHEREWRHIAARPWLAGGIMWSVIEYHGETTGWPIVTSQFGALDVCRFPKDVYHFYRQEWGGKPMLHLFPHWTWPGREGEPIEVWCYSSCDTVDLFLNGEPQRGIPHHLQFKAGRPHLYWSVPYAPGTLRAEGRLEGKVVCVQEIKTAGKPASLSLSPDRTVLHADGEDVAFVTIGVRDAEGVPVPMADNAVMVEVGGAGRLLGLASGDPGSHESVKASGVKAFNGLCLAIVQSSDSAGEIQVTASSPGLPSARIGLRSQPR